MTPLPSTLVRAARSIRSRSFLAVLVELHLDLDDAEFRKPPVCVIANRLDVSERHVYSAIRQLARMGFLESGPRNGNALTFRISNRLCTTVQ